MVDRKGRSFAKCPRETRSSPISHPSNFHFNKSCYIRLSSFDRRTGQPCVEALDAMRVGDRAGYQRFVSARLEATFYHHLESFSTVKICAVIRFCRRDDS
ncbi:MAG TPA: hypothetical protein VMU57_10710 [Edaphobacter sp.]|uniref:hypothetical protein n=1 Tax=Edaphobacter sp. TaxID=1934404 RepID=UPI002BB7CA3B|nr:hypothetical protein [Edaphobacter sp.]HUZ95374.1 hypothetical protein [Edaphobacter sp.]